MVQPKVSDNRERECGRTSRTRKTQEKCKKNVRKVLDDINAIFGNFILVRTTQNHSGTAQV